MKTVWLVSGVHFHHSDLPPAFPAWAGSPNSFVAAVFVPFTSVFTPGMTMALANASLLGAAPGAAAADNNTPTTNIPPLSFPITHLIVWHGSNRVDRGASIQLLGRQARCIPLSSSKLHSHPPHEHSLARQLLIGVQRIEPI